MVHLPKDWRFLRAAWLYAVVLTGDANRSLDLVQSVLAGIGRRQDLVGLRRRRRLFFALVRREGNVLVVRGLDCIDGTPLVDLKPDSCAYTPLAPAKAGMSEG